MATSALRIPIPFHLLLRKITKFLNFHEPESQFLEGAENNMCITVKADEGPVAYVYVGGEAATLGESLERVSRIAVRDLVKKYSILVEDVTFNKSIVLRRCAHLYKLKRYKLGGRKKRQRGKGKGHSRGRSVCVSGTVSIDYMSVVKTIFREIDIRTTPVETAEICPGQFVAWITMTPLHSRTAEECLISELCSNAEDAEQELANKIISYVSPLYNIEIVDVNYGSQESAYSSVLCALERDSYFTVKERMLGIRGVRKATPFPVEEGYVTPCESARRIPNMVCPPPPPKKRRCTAGCCSKKLPGAAQNYFKLPDGWDAKWKSSAENEGDAES